MIGKLDEALRFHETALSLRAQRQQLLASNIANADTPNYKARDVDFNAALGQALARAPGTAGPAQLARTQASHIPAGSATATSGGADVQYRTGQQNNIDGNSVDMDVERNQFADNALRYEASVTLIGAQIKNLLAAIQG
ncbi:flagellar basal-body rod protein FlgB [Noviherbaspirillum humi]|uniref:Flagellar basal body rod protein FlgB n=1 Tax=Noviherbaspirillum humi TaxID=1688639 RepID=A0A239FWN7_9BURK|nr:flagellar basal body rod protein FlgB [Noviherbaspirillum humi]SNS60918.1 flagellar basal-body rod protein FlgB [Noviherbaspirillum humi]